MKKTFSIVVIIAIVFASCQKQGTTASSRDPDKVAIKDNDDAQTMNSDEDFNSRHRHQQLSFKTRAQLLQARAASARYRDFDKAIHDGYEDIHVVMQNMGFHFMKSKFVDSVFDVRHPEILVYNKDRWGRFQLVAVEYAVPLDASVNAPEGFAGDNDVWDHNDEFGLWLLHAWVWRFNPDGVFNPTNQTVHVQM
jgi:hypothetical protein